jgi:hypothetical protein
MNDRNDGFYALLLAFFLMVGLWFAGMYDIIDFSGLDGRCPKGSSQIKGFVAGHYTNICVQQQ